MSTTKTSTVEVKPVLFHSTAAPIIKDWPKERRPIGYLPMIFGTNWFGNHGLLCSALEHVDTGWKDPDESDLYDTAQEAMDAWEAASPTEMVLTLSSRNKIPPETVKQIHDLGLFRRTNGES